MATKKAPAKKAAAKAKPTTTTSASGVELVNGQPYFGTVDGVRMNRREWLDATRAERTKKLSADLRAIVDAES